MSYFLQLNLVAPLQSWGATSKANNRATEHHPTKSGVFGLIGNAMGVPREESSVLLEKLQGVKVHSRVDAPGKLLRDYGTVAYNGKTKQVNRFYLQNAKFIVLVEGEKEVLEEVYKALRSPQNPIFLGRKSCVPSIPVYVPDVTKAIHEVDDVTEVFRSLPLLISETDLTGTSRRKEYLKTEIILETTEITGERLMDHPVSFSSKARLYSPRNIKTLKLDIKNPFYIEETSIEREVFINPMEGIV